MRERLGLAACYTADMDDWDKLEAELLDDPETRAAYDKLMERMEFAHAVMGLRAALGLSQRELAARVGMHQPEIARIERGRTLPTWGTVARIFNAVGAEVEAKVRDKDGNVVRLALTAGANSL